MAEVLQISYKYDGHALDLLPDPWVFWVMHQEPQKDLHSILGHASVGSYASVEVESLPVIRGPLENVHHYCCCSILVSPAHAVQGRCGRDLQNVQGHQLLQFWPLRLLRLVG